jgi:serine/threonine protein kinase
MIGQEMKNLSSWLLHGDDAGVTPSLFGMWKPHGPADREPVAKRARSESYGICTCAPTSSSPAQSPSSDDDEDDTIIFANGTYGLVEINRSSPTVTKTMYLHSEEDQTKARRNPKRRLIASNVMEAAVAARLVDAPVRGVVRYRLVEMDPARKMLSISMDKGRLGNLSEYVTTHTLEERMTQLHELVWQLATAIHGLHESAHVVHADLKPGNVVVLDDGDGPTDPISVRVIDLGSAVYHPYAPAKGGFTGILCTCEYAPPEAIHHDGGIMDPKLIDAYSIGCLIYYVATGQHLAYSRGGQEQGRRAAVAAAHATGLMPGPVAPAGVPQDMWDVMRELLRPDPARRMSVRELVARLRSARSGGAEDPEPPAASPSAARASTAASTSTIDPPDACACAWTDAQTRDKAIEYMFRKCGVRARRAFGLACNLADRFAAAMRRPCAMPELHACVALAACCLHCCDAPIDMHAPRVCAAVADVMDALQCRLFSEVCDVRLVVRHGVHPARLKYGTLKEAVKACASGRTADIVADYTRRVYGSFK